MSSQDLPYSSEVLLLSSPMKAERRRHKERLEASLAGLCELQLLRQRQESRVLGALCLGNSPPGDGLTPASCRVERGSEDCGVTVQSSPSSVIICLSFLEIPHEFPCVFFILSFQNSLQCTAWMPLRSSLEQQVAELKVKPVDSSDDDNSQLSSAKACITTQSESPEPTCQRLMARFFLSPDGSGETETEETRMLNATGRAVATDTAGAMRYGDSSWHDYQHIRKLETYIQDLIQRRTQFTRPSKPRTSLVHNAQGVSVARQSSLCVREEQQSPNQVFSQEIPAISQCSEEVSLLTCHNVNQEHYPRITFSKDATPTHHHHHVAQSVQNQTGFHYTPGEAAMNNSCSASHDYSSYRILQIHPDSSKSDPDSPQHFHNISPLPALKPHQLSTPDKRLVSADYIPAQPYCASSRAYANHHSSHHKSFTVSKTNRSTFSPERGHYQEQQRPTASQIQALRPRGSPKKCRSNEDRSSARKPGRKASRSQSENSLQKFSEHKYITVERDRSAVKGSRGNQSRNKKQQQGSSSNRRWQSTVELSQDEADQPPVQASGQCASVSRQQHHCVRHTRKSRSTHVSYAYHPHQHQHMDYHLQRGQREICQPTEEYSQSCQGESESSMSEADSPDSSTLSSDSDESGGLVWPQQLPPQLSLSSPPAPVGVSLQPKAFVKIKASHALKKKILRFRTGSLKVMTTV
ncbi:uncharacterized protein KZ484_007294 [Pholidichthys leucotaenia]